MSLSLSTVVASVKRLFAANVLDTGNGGTIYSSNSGLCRIQVGAVNETRTLQTPSKAQERLTLVVMSTTGGEVVVTTPFPYNIAGNTGLRFTATAGAFATLISVPVGDTATIRWRLCCSNGVTLQ